MSNYIKGKQIKNNTITQDKLNLSTPINNSDAATKLYVDNQSTGATSLEKMSLSNKEMLALDTTAGSGYVLACNTAVLDVPLTTSKVNVLLNGVLIEHGIGKFCFFSGSTIKDEITNFVSQGDYLYWNKNVATFNLTTDDRLDFEYIISNKTLTIIDASNLNLSELDDVTISNLNNKQVIMFTGSTNKWINKTLVLEDNANVLISSLVSGHTLKFQNGYWRNIDPRIETTLALNASGNTIDFTAANIFTVTLSANTNYSFTNYNVGYTCSFFITGNNFTPTFNNATLIGGNYYDSTKENLFVFKVYKTSPIDIKYTVNSL